MDSSLIKNLQNLLLNAQSDQDRQARKIALQILDATLKASNPYDLVKKQVHLQGNLLTITSQTINLDDYDHIYIIGAGKASGIMAEAIHKQDVKENLSATSALIDDTSERISDYLKIGKIGLSYFVSKNVMVWMLPIMPPKCDDRYMLLVTKAITILTGMPKSALKLLGKEEIFVPELLKISSKWVAKVCKE